MSNQLVRRAVPKPARRPTPVKNSGESRTRDIVNRRSDRLCERCGGVGHSVHHRKNRSQGGLWTPTNCVRVCGDGSRLCHGWFGQHPDAARTEGFALKRGDDPTTIPITHWLHGAVHLDAAGGYTLT